ncbi:hypothetical protein [Mycolicibacterium sp.]|uniref:hypothetical protein n=1 Tax=Mycolicibacterium sp. TaxID=2320850 RepID=UPI003D0AA336
MLGGFLITAIALLFDRKGREGVHTLALFASAVLILMLDSFVFSVMTGTQVPSGPAGEGVCAIGWTQGALSTGMLAAGAAALFGGLGWMLATHAVNRVSGEDTDDASAYRFLAGLGGWITFAAAMAATLILSETTIDYLRFMTDGRTPAWLVAAITTTSAIAVLVDFALVYLRTRVLRKSLSDNSEGTQLALRSIKVATVGLVVLAIGATWLAVSLARLPKPWLTEPNVGVLIVVAALTFAVPTGVATAICNSVASTEDRGWRGRRVQSRATSA